MPDYIALYRAYLEQEKHASPNTVSSYVRDLTQFRAWLPQGSDLRRVKPAAVDVQRQGDGTMSTVAFGRQHGQTSAIPAADTLHGFGDMDYPVL